MAKGPEILGLINWRVFTIYPDGEVKKQPRNQVIPVVIARRFDIKSGSVAKIRIKNEKSMEDKIFSLDIFSGTEFEIPDEIFDPTASYYCVLAFDEMEPEPDILSSALTEKELGRKSRVFLNLKRIYFQRDICRCQLTGVIWRTLWRSLIFCLGRIRVISREEV